ncbi:NCS2 family permease [Companilactobacillus baiquanensis]|uniref:NCS2 family permease n=1 Tax=Companilactobacillus baiquanensis TaxID=2486005 RepID=A0ABW1UV75_9LACO|nr:NCS2 family permease [Companilactobacillus baiquanensis]
MLQNIKNGISLKKEIIAGVTSFFAISYILIVNPMILKDAGMPIEITFFATAISSFIGCIIMAFWGDSPITLTPGMGVNAFFTYTLVGSMGLTWEQALTVSLFSGIIYAVVAFTPLSSILSEDIPDNLKRGITVGIGLFLVELGMEKAEIIKSGGSHSLLSFGSITNASTLVAFLGILICLFLMMKKIPGDFLIGIIITTVIAKLLNVTGSAKSVVSLSDIGLFSHSLLQFDFSGLFSAKFIIAIFSMSMILIFESMGLLQGLLEDTKKFKKAFQASSITAILSAGLSTSPTVAAAESASGIQSGGRSGITALVTGILFGISVIAAPLIALIPQAAISPVIIITGAIMMKELSSIDMRELDDWIPAFLIITLIPLTGSISTGLQFGFISYPLVKIFSKKMEDINPVIMIVSVLFLINLILSAVI